MKKTGQKSIVAHFGPELALRLGGTNVGDQGWRQPLLPAYDEKTRQIGPKLAHPGNRLVHVRYVCSVILFSLRVVFSLYSALSVWPGCQPVTKVPNCFQAGVDSFERLA